VAKRGASTAAWGSISNTAMSRNTSTGCRPRATSSAPRKIICWFDQGSMVPRAELERAMRQFVEQVMPEFASG